jgi:hypothetical protein
MPLGTALAGCSWNPNPARPLQRGLGASGLRCCCSYRWGNLFNAPLLHATWVPRCDKAFGRLLGRLTNPGKSPEQPHEHGEFRLHRRLGDQALGVGRGFLRLEPYLNRAEARPPPAPPTPPLLQQPACRDRRPGRSRPHRPPYGGPADRVSGRAGQLWINVATRPVGQIQLGTKVLSNCWWGTKVVTPAHTYIRGANCVTSRKIRRRNRSRQSP